MNFFFDDESSKVNYPQRGDETNPPAWPDSVVIVNQDTDPATLTQVRRKGADPGLEDCSEVYTKYTAADPSVTADDLQKWQAKGPNGENPALPSFPADGSGFRTYISDEDHFKDTRTAILFEKGTYKFDFQVGYYTQCLGLGKKAGDVVFSGCDYGIHAPAYNKDRIIKGIDGGGNAYPVQGISLDTFWRSAENFTNDTKEGLLWAVSQAAPIRRIHAKGPRASLHDGTAYSSGGHMANMQIDGTLEFGTQQQFCCRSVSMSVDGDGTPNETGGAFSKVFVNCKNAPETTVPTGGGLAVTSSTAVVTVEKPYIVKDGDKFFLQVPKPRISTDDSGENVGADLEGKTDESRSFTRVYVAKADYEPGKPDMGVAKKINKALSQGKDVVLSPGIFHLSETIMLQKKNQVLLGIGMATLVAPTNGCPCVQVASGIPGVRVAGIMFEASRQKHKLFGVASFLEWGVAGKKDPGLRENPGVMSDIFCRVGGGNLDRTVSTDVMVRVHSSHVLGDNLWLWRADHVKLGDHELPNFPPLDYHQVVLGEVPCKTGLEVYGDNVTIHGLAVEHTTEHQVRWFGENGNVQFYQCEFPYDVTTEFGEKNYLGYLVEPTVDSHKLGAPGVYSNFRDHNVLAKSAIQHPKIFETDSNVVNPFTKQLDNQGFIMTVVTDGEQYGGGPANNRNLARFQLGVKQEEPAHVKKILPSDGEKYRLCYARVESFHGPLSR